MGKHDNQGYCPGGDYSGCPKSGSQGVQKGKCERCGFDFDQEHLTSASVEAAKEAARAEIARKEEVEREEADRAEAKKAKRESADALEKKRSAYRSEWEKAKGGRNIAELRSLLERAVGVRDEYKDIVAEHQKSGQVLLDEWQDDADWADANKAGRTQPEGWKNYVASHPQGRHAEEARQKVKENEESGNKGFKPLPVVIGILVAGIIGYGLGNKKESAEAVSAPAPTPAPPFVAGHEMRVCSDCPELVAIPGGSFLMGSPEGEVGRGDDEGPQHRVSVPAFWMGKTEVTQGQWKAVMGSNPSNFNLCGDDCPVEMVNWDDVQEFLKKLNARTGKQYRLPSEAEWEYAARAGTTTAFHTGNCVKTNQANYDGNDDDYNYCGAKTGVYQGKTVKIGSYAASAFGLHDMIGNVWEWTQDCWNGSYRGAPTNGGAWTSGDCGRRVFRGGSWSSKPQNARSADRSWFTTGDRSNGNGFRVALSAARTLP